MVGGLAFSGAGFRVFGVLWVGAFISGLAEGAGRCLFGAYGPFNLVLFCCLLGRRWSSRLIFFFLCGHLGPPTNLTNSASAPVATHIYRFISNNYASFHLW